MSELDSIPIVDKQPTKYATTKTLHRQLSAQVHAAMDLFVEVMNDKRIELKHRLSAARDVANYYIKLDGMNNEAVLQEQTKRMNALRINRMVDDNERARNATNGKIAPPPNALSFDIEKPESYS